MRCFSDYAARQVELNTSDFLFSARRDISDQLGRILSRYLSPVAPVVELRGGEWGSLAIVRCTHDDPRVLVEDANDVSVLIGDPVISGGSFTHGTTRNELRRLHLHELLRTGAVQWRDQVDGQYAVLHVEKRSGRFTSVTDRFAFIPVFTAKSATNDCVIGTHVDAVASAAGRQHDVDLVSVADVLETLTCTVPHTVYTGVTQQRAATVVTIDAPARETSVAYWEPAESNRPASIGEAAEVLRSGIADDIGAAISDVTSAGVLLSAGEDSRALLGAIEARVPVTAVTFASWQSREARIAARVARAHGAEHILALRTPTHYTDGFRTVSAMMGSHHLFTDVHGFGLHEKVGLNAMPIVIGGLSSDSLLKGTYVSKPPVPVKARSVDSLIRKDLLDEAHLRREAHRRELEAIRPRSAREWSYLWPFSMRKHGGNVDGNRRLFAIHEPYHCNAALDIAAATPVEWKLRRRLFVEAMKPFFRQTRFVPHADYLFPAFGAEVNMALRPGLAVARGIRAIAKGETRVRQRSWPTWGSVANSAEARTIREQWPLRESPIREAFGPQRADAVDSEIGTWYSLRRLALMQLVYLSHLNA